jgi:hypothetical protein
VGVEVERAVYFERNALAGRVADHDVCRAVFPDNHFALQAGMCFILGGLVA